MQSQINLLQSKNRIFRKKPIIYDHIAKIETIDERITKSLKIKKTLTLPNKTVPV